MVGKSLFIVLLLGAMQLSGAVKKYDITVGTAPEKFIVQKICGKTLQIECLMPHGKNMHDFNVTPSMLKAVGQSKIFFHAGLLFESQIAEAIHNSSTKIVDIAAHIPKLHMANAINNEHNANIEDVHTWFSYRNLSAMADEVYKVLSENYARHADEFKKNHDMFLLEIKKSREEAAKKLRRFAGRTFLTHHAAFGYFAHDFNLKQLPFEFNGRDITPRHAAILSKYAREHNLKRIFIQHTASSNVRRALQNSTNAGLVILNPADEDVLGTMNRFASELEAAFE